MVTEGVSEVVVAVGGSMLLLFGIVLGMVLMLVELVVFE